MSPPTSKVAVVGSRDLAPLATVRRWLEWLHGAHPDTLLISGGARGVDKTAEEAWLELGHRVRSYRPKKVRGDQLHEDVWGVDVWELGGPNPSVRHLHGHPTWADFRSAAGYRNILIAQDADRVVAFYRPGKSQGTRLTVALARDMGKEVHEIEGEQHESQP